MEQTERKWGLDTPVLLLLNIKILHFLFIFIFLTWHLSEFTITFMKKKEEKKDL